MEVNNKFSMNFTARSSNEGFARSVVAAFVLQLDPTIEELSDIKTAVSEAVTNCIVHAYKEQSLGKIYINGEITDNSTVRIKIRDRGCGIPNIEQALQPLFTTVGGERAGLGFAVMQSFMDELKVRSVPNKGTTVYMSKRIQPRLHMNG